MRTRALPIKLSEHPFHHPAQGRVSLDTCASRSLQNSAMHLRKVCAHPYLFLAHQHPPYQPADPLELVRASGKLHLLDNILPKLRATGARALWRSC